MTREILFRGKRIDNGAWVEGFYFNNGNNAFIFTFPYHANYADIKIMHEIDPATVGQYINVTDKNGKRVFEGDIVQRLHWGNKVLVTPVVYDPEWNRFAVFSDGAESYGVTKYSDFEVIGNIHDKPELREAAK